MGIIGTSTSSAWSSTRTESIGVDSYLKWLPITLGSIKEPVQKYTIS